MTSSAVALFSANNGSGAELWRTDGTAAGTFALTSVQPGPLTYLDGIAYFVAPDGNAAFGPQFQLWRTDGTVAGTFAIGLSPSANTSAPELMQLGSKIFYIGQDATHREALFETDGVHQGVFVGNLNSTPNITFNASFVGTVGADLLIEVGNALWVSDGTSAGTHTLSDGETGSTLAVNLPPVLLNGKAYFTADDGVHGEQLWETNGTTATSVADPASGSFGSTLMVLGNEIIFATSSNSGMSLVAWDGVSANATTLYSTGIGISNLQVVNGQAYFTAFTPGNGPEGLFVSDGTVAGTQELASGVYASFAKIGGAYLLNDQQNVYLTTGLASGNTLVAPGTNNLTTFVQVGSHVFFVADNNTQLWISDGTVAGTHMVLGGLSSPSNLAAMGNELVFTASTDGVNFEPWVSDGTAGGTHVVTNVHPENPGSLTMADMGSFDGHLVFFGSTATTGASVWVSDGTAAGTGVLETLQSGTAQFPPLVASGGKLFFTIAGGNGDQLWVADAAVPGAAATPIPGAVLNPNMAFMTAFDSSLFYYSINAGGTFITDGTGASPTLLTSATVLAQPIQLNNDLLFFGSTVANGTGLFETDGTPGGTAFIAALPSAITPATPTISGSQVFFTAGDTSTGAELWVTDGTAPGTHLVEDIAPGAAGSSPTQLTAFDGGVIFDANDQTHGNQVWFSNGTAAGTFSLAINQTHNATASLQTSPAVQFGGKAYFVANDGAHGDQLWSSDGTAAGTGVVTELSLTATQLQASYLTVLGGKLFFVDGVVPWISDGTAAGTSELQIGGGVTVDFSSQSPVLFQGRLFFEGDIAGVGNPALFVTDGTSAGSSELGLADIIAQIPGFAVGGNNLIYFSSDGLGDFGLFAYNALTNVKTFLASTPSNVAFAINVGGQIQIGTPPQFGSQAIWVTDGTAAGTSLLVQNTQDTFSDYTSLGGKLYFLSFGPTGGLWVSNGTAAGTHVASSLAIQNDTLTPIGTNLFFIATQSNVTSAYIFNTTSQTAAVISAPAVKSVPFDVTPVGTGAFFVADDATSQGELWHTTSTGAVVELTSASNGEVAGPNAPIPQFAVSGSSLFFSGDDSVHGQGLFISNGATTTFLASMTNPSDFSLVGSLLYFEGTDATNGTELWVSNGTAAGTHRLTDTESAGSANGSDFVAVGAKMFFSANDGVHGQELWAFNGTPGGAVMVADINPGASSSNPSQLTALGGNVYFVATGPSGSELWRSDGTSAGTVAITTANPQDLTLDGTELFFFGSDSAHGSGLFVSNGTTGGTTFLGAFSAAADFTVAGGEFYFLGTNGLGTELWTSNGTVAGTTVLSQTGINPGSSPTDVVTLPGPTLPSDFNGDGGSDVLWRDANGSVDLYDSNGGGGFSGFANQGLGIVDNGWGIEQVGDFNGDGKADILWRNTNGDVFLDLSNAGTGFTGVAGQDLGVIPTSWTIEQVGDFNGDGKADILWRNVNGDVELYLSSAGPGFTGFAAQDLGVIPTSWSIQSVGDFNGDGKTDILWRNTTTGDVELYLSNPGFGFTGFAGVDLGALGPSWTLQQVGDFNGVGKDGMLWRNSNGDVELYLANAGAGFTGFTVVDVGVISSDWSIQTVGDYNGDGKTDILWRNTNGDVVFWLSNPGAGYTGFTSLDNGVVGTDWTIVGDRPPALGSKPGPGADLPAPAAAQASVAHASAAAGPAADAATLVATHLSHEAETGMPVAVLDNFHTHADYFLFG